MSRNKVFVSSAISFAKPSLLACLCALFLLSLAVLLPQEAFARGNPKYASIVIDADTGMVLRQSYADKRLHPASLTKIMTLLMTFEALEQGRLRLNERIRISRHAASMVPSKLDLPAGASIRVKDAIYALVTKSANDVAVALAERLSGTELLFARQMTRRAQEIGLRSTRFTNASGLHDRRQISTARDMALLAQYVINRYPNYYRYFSTKSFTYRGKTYRNHNRLLGKYKGMDGMKTGYINASGFNLVASAVRNNRRVIGVVFGGRSGRTRNAHMAKILDQGFAKLKDIRLASANIPVPERKPGLLLALASLNQVSPSAGSNYNTDENHFDDFEGDQKWAMLNPSLRDGMFSRLIGQGDYDPAASQRIETGLMAIAAHKGEHLSAHTNDIKNAVRSATSVKPRNWAIQVGTFSSRSSSDKAIANTMAGLPDYLTGGRPFIAPMKKNNRWLFRARLDGYNKDQAMAACKFIRDCLPVAPR